MNNKQILDEMFSNFSVSFNKFREDFHNITNDVMNYRISENVARNDEVDFIKNRVEELDKLIDEGTNGLNNLSSDLTPEEIEYQKERINAQLKGYTEEKEFLEKRSAELTKNSESKTKDYRDSFKASIKEMRDALNIVEINGTKVSKVDLLIDNVKTQLNLIEYRLITLKAELDKAQGMEREPIAKEMEKLTKKRAKYNKFIKNINEFMIALDSLETKYVNGYSYIDIMDLNKFDPIFEELADSLDKNVEKSLISINIITNDDGTYSLDMRCGNKIAEPRPVIKAEDLNERTINQYLDGFVYSVATKTEFSVEDLKKGEVIVKNNNVSMGKVSFKDAGKVVESKSMSAPKADEPAQDVPKADEPAQDVPKADEPTQDVPKADEPTQDVPKVDEPTQDVPKVDEPAQDAPKADEPAQDAPKVDEPAQDAPKADEPAQDAPINDNSGFVNKEDEQLHKVINSRNATNSKFKKAEILLGVAACGLGFAGVTPLAGMAVGAFLVTAGIDLGADLIDKIKYNAVVRKLNKIAKKNNVIFDFQPENGICRFVHRGKDNEQEPIVVNSYSVSGLSDIKADDLKEDLDKAFKNKNRGKGVNARSISEINNRDLSPVTIDNLASAFTSLGGLQTKKERKAFKLSNTKIAEIINRNKKAKAQGDDTLENNITPEELEKMEANVNAPNTQEEKAIDVEAREITPEVTPVAPVDTTLAEDNASELAAQIDSAANEVPFEPIVEEPPVVEAPTGPTETEVEDFMNSLNNNDSVRNLSDDHLQSIYRRAKETINLKGEAGLGEYLLSVYTSADFPLSKADFEYLQGLDVNKEFFTDETKQEMFGKELNK